MDLVLKTVLYLEQNNSEQHLIEFIQKLLIADLTASINFHGGNGWMLFVVKWIDLQACNMHKKSAFQRM